MNKENMKSPAVNTYNQGFNCAQAIVSAFGPQLGLPLEVALKLPLPFGGGIANTGDTCGAVTGALMVIGLKYGSIDPKDKNAKKKVYKLSKSFMKKFKSRNGAVECRKLLNLDVGSIAGIIKAKKNRSFKKICPKYVEDASDIVSEILNN